MVAVELGSAATVSTGGVYLNYLGDDRNEALVRAAFGANYERLAAVKGKYRSGEQIPAQSEHSAQRDTVMP